MALLLLLAGSSCAVRRCPPCRDVNVDQCLMPQWAQELTGCCSGGDWDSFSAVEMETLPCCGPQDEIIASGRLPSTQAELPDFSQPWTATAPYTPPPSAEPLFLPGATAGSGCNVLIQNSNSMPPPFPEGPPLPPEEPLSRIEQLYDNADGYSRGMRLRQWGYDTFQSDDGGRRDAFFRRKLLFEDRGPMDPQFVVGLDDEVLVRTMGDIAIDETLTVDRNGNIFIPNVGPVAVGGSTSQELKDIVNNAISKQYRTYDLEVSLGKVHAIRVIVTGHVAVPGLKNVPANTPLLDALFLAGGPTKDGTLRHVILHRQGQPDRHIDLYDLLLAGDRSQDIPLLTGDVISVGAVGPTVAIIGPLQQGIYELKGSSSLSQIAQYGGGVNAFTATNMVMVSRVRRDGSRAVEAVSYRQDAHLYQLQDGDVVFFIEVEGDINNTVMVSGAVVRPGLYPYKEGLRISDLLRSSQGLLLGASKKRALLMRSLGDTCRFDNIYGDAQAISHRQSIWIDLYAILKGDAKADLPLERLDHLKILTLEEAQETPSVMILGAVRQPGRYQLTSRMTLSDLLQLAGGPSSAAFGGTSYIVRRTPAKEGCQYDAKIIAFCLEKALEGDEGAIALKNLDQVVIRQVQSMQVSVNVSGRVAFPGTYILPQGSKISDLIAAAGGVLPDGDLRAANFVRESVKMLQEDRLQHLVMLTEDRLSRQRDFLTRDGNVNESLAGQLQLLGVSRMENFLRRFHSNGRVILNFLHPCFPDTLDNLVLEDGDTLDIPLRNNAVVVTGEVFSPSAFAWHPFMTVGQYIGKSGGFKCIASPSQVYVLLANGEVRSSSQIGWQRLAQYVPGPGDAILVPPKEMHRSPRLVAHDYLNLLREAVEIALVGASIPSATNSQNSNVTIDLKKPDIAIPVNQGRPLDEVLLYELYKKTPEFPGVKQ